MHSLPQMLIGFYLLAGHLHILKVTVMDGSTHSDVSTKYCSELVLATTVETGPALVWKDDQITLMLSYLVWPLNS